MFKTMLVTAIAATAAFASASECKAADTTADKLIACNKGWNRSSDPIYQCISPILSNAPSSDDTATIIKMACGSVHFYTSCVLDGATYAVERPASGKDPASQTSYRMGLADLLLSRRNEPTAGYRHSSVPTCANPLAVGKDCRYIDPNNPAAQIAGYIISQDQTPDGPFKKLVNCLNNRSIEHTQCMAWDAHLSNRSKSYFDDYIAGALTPSSASNAVSDPQDLALLAIKYYANRGDIVSDATRYDAEAYEDSKKAALRRPLPQIISSPAEQAPLTGFAESDLTPS